MFWLNVVIKAFVHKIRSLRLYLLNVKMCKNDGLSWDSDKSLIFYILTGNGKY